MRNKKKQKNLIYESSDRWTKKYCNIGTALEQSEEKQNGGLNEFYSHENSPFSPAAPYYKLQSNLVISTSLISNNRLSRNEKSGPC